MLCVVPVMEIHTSLGEITGTLKKLKDADPAYSHLAVKKQDIVKQDIVTADGDRRDEPLAG